MGQPEAALLCLLSLDADARKRLIYMGDKSEVFTRQTLRVLEQNPQIAPPNLNLAAGYRSQIEYICSHFEYKCSRIENMKPFIHHLLGETRTAILTVLLMRPERAQPVRELMRITGVSPGTLHRELNALVVYGLLLRQQIGSQVFYRANPDYPVTPELTGLIRKTSGLVDVLRQALAPIMDRIDAAFVYGSMARGDPHADSDIDLMIIGRTNLGEVVLALDQAHTLLRRDINPTVFTPEQWAQRLAQQDSFADDVSSKAKLWLTGNKDEPG